MRKQISAAVAATFLLGAAAVAHAGEGSPDLALPGVAGSDPSGDTSSGGAFNNGFRAPAYGFSAPGYDDGFTRRSRADTNAGSALRQRLYEEENGVNGE